MHNVQHYIAPLRRGNRLDHKGKIDKMKHPYAQEYRTASQEAFCQVPFYIYGCFFYKAFFLLGREKQ